MGKTEAELSVREFVLFSLIHAHHHAWERTFIDNGAREQHHIWRMQWWHGIQAEFAAELFKHGYWT